MLTADPRERTRLVIAIILAGIGVAAFVGLALSSHLTRITELIWDIFQDRAHFRTYIESWGGWAPAAFVALQGLQVIIAPIPGELTGAVGGFIFGGLPTVLYSSLGLTLGSLVNFLIARIIGLPFVKLVVSRETLEKFHFLTERRGALLAFVLFLIPGFPKDILSYILGLSPMRLLTFAIVCTLGRIPGTVMLSFSGAAVYQENWRLLIIIAVICAISLGAMYLWRNDIDEWLKRRGKHHRSDMRERDGA
ncbi:MAG: TVP38/TMEM64 family protein [Thermodesulfobacteriota bacterium]